MVEILEKYLPAAALQSCFDLIKSQNVHLKIVNKRKTRHGDYRQLPNGSHVITVNATENNYRFLITLIHEIAHLVAFQRYDLRIKPHGVEWKQTFIELMKPFLNERIFPQRLLPVLHHHFKNPKASSSTDHLLDKALMQYDIKSNDKQLLSELPLGSIFAYGKGRWFQKGKKRIKRFECTELDSKRVFLFQPNVWVDLAI